MMLENILGGGQLEQTAARQYNAWVRDVFESRFGYIPPTQSATRSSASQKVLYTAYVARGRRAPIVALPGYSLHERGLADDVHGGIEQAHSEQHALAAATLPDYGFSVDAIPGEPWHIQFDRPVITFAGSDSTPLPTTPTEEETMARAIVNEQQGSPDFAKIAVVTENGQLHIVTPQNRPWWDNLARCYTPTLVATSVNQAQFSTFIAAQQPQK